jgi:hypothetical protein
VKAALALAALPLAAAALLAGCGSAAPAASGPPPQAPPGGAPFLATSLTTGAGTWAVVVMGGSVAAENNFWQLFVRPAGSGTWKLVTPPGTADNGGLVLAGDGAQSLITGFRPSQYLTYTPLTLTRDDGQAWSSAGPLDAALADVPDALAAAPGTGTLLALTTGGTAELAAPGYTSWTTLATQRSLGATAAGRRCGLQDLTAAAFVSPGTSLLGGACNHPGTAGIFASTGGTWHAAGPAIPAALAGRDITVRRLTQTGPNLAALLTAGTGPAASLLAAWSADDGGHWTVSPPLPLHGATLASTSFGPGGTAAVITTAGRGEIIASTGSSWQPLPPLPSGTATLAPGPGGTADALAVNRGTLTVWHLAAGATAWTQTQVIKVAIQYGSSS